MTDAVITVRGLGKQYGFSLGKLDQYLGLDKKRPWALRDVSFDVRPGEFVGIIGHNGAGKTTLLKTLAGILPVTQGAIDVRGSVSAMIELNAGTHQELSGRENIMLLAAFLGLGRREMRRRMKAIEQFCELGDWLNKPIWKYSKGMKARLGFSVAVNVDADLLLVDEVLAVGDISFQRKCFDRMQEMHRRGSTVLLVSHSVYKVQRICERVLLLDKGHLVQDGPSREVINTYYEMSAQRSLERVRTKQKPGAPGAPRDVTTGAFIENVRLLDSQGREAKIIETGDSLCVDLELQMNEKVENPVIGIVISTTELITVCNVTTENVEVTLDGRKSCRCLMPSMPLLSGVYLVSVGVKSRDNRRLCEAEHVAEFAVRDNALNGYSSGLVKIPAEWSFAG